MIKFLKINNQMNIFMGLKDTFLNYLKIFIPSENKIILSKMIFAFKNL